mgnify:CR=1 FL=1
MKKLSYLFLAFLGISFVVVSCSDDDEGGGNVPGAPSITAPPQTTVGAGETATVSFSVTIPGGFRSSNATASGGTASVSQDLAAGATSGTIQVDFTAGQDAGAGSVILAVTDNNTLAASQTAVFTIEAADNTVTVTNNITSDETWSAANTYILASRIAVEDGATLTIEPGTLIKGEAGTGANATALLLSLIHISEPTRRH